jgi:hypothetical protein
MYQVITQAGVSFVGYQWGFWEDLLEFRVTLDDVEILHEDVLLFVSGDM